MDDEQHERHGWGAYYDDFAGRYDAVTDRRGWDPNAALPETLAPLGLEPSTVLDLGAGTGQTAEALLRLYPRARFTLVDVSAQMLDHARPKLAGGALEAAHVADALSFLEGDPSSHDLVVGVGFLELVPDLLSTLAAAAEHVAPGGHLAITHEPRLATGTQARPRSAIDADRGWVISRHHPDVVRAAVTAAVPAMELVVEREVVAYQRGDTREDVVYELLVWRRPPA